MDSSKTMLVGQRFAGEGIRGVRGGTSALMEAQTLQFENARVLASLHANDLKLLKQLEDALEVKLTARDGWLRVEGEAEKVDQTRRVFEQLERARQNGSTIRKHEFLYALRSVTEPEEGGLDALADTKIQFSSKRPPILPRTAGQRGYIRAIQTSDMVCRIGPAGTARLTWRWRWRWLP
jgi:phosphate starvation-inducible PhoH-like protein